MFAFGSKELGFISHQPWKFSRSREKLSIIIIDQNWFAARTVFWCRTKIARGKNYHNEFNLFFHAGSSVFFDILQLFDLLSWITTLHVLCTAMTGFISLLQQSKRFLLSTAYSVNPPPLIKFSSPCFTIWLWLAKTCIRQFLFSHFSLAFNNVCKQKESGSVSVAAILTNDWNWTTLLWQVDFRFGMGCAIPIRNQCPIWIHVKNIKQFLCIITSDCLCLTSYT